LKEFAQPSALEMVSIRVAAVSAFVAGEESSVACRPPTVKIRHVGVAMGSVLKGSVFVPLATLELTVLLVCNALPIFSNNKES